MINAKTTKQRPRKASVSKNETGTKGNQTYEAGDNIEWL